MSTASYHGGSVVPTPTSRQPSTSLQQAGGADKIKRHDEWYLTSGDVIFLVDNYLYRVHRYFFERESGYWRQRFSAPSPPGQPPKGSSDYSPWPLPGVNPVDFSRFLWVFYNQKYSIFEANGDEWISILKLSCEWGFDEVRGFALRQLETKYQEPLDKIQLYHTYKIDKILLIPSYIAMALRPEPLTLAEGKLLGLETALALARAREFARGVKSSKTGLRESSKVSLDPARMDELIREIFLAPSEDAEEEERVQQEIERAPSMMNSTAHLSTASSVNGGPPTRPESPDHASVSGASNYYYQQHQAQPQLNSDAFVNPPVGQRELSHIWNPTPSTDGHPATDTRFTPTVGSPPANYNGLGLGTPQMPARQAEIPATPRNNNPYAAAGSISDAGAMSAAEEAEKEEQENWFGGARKTKKKVGGK
jgi:hypothetical protein